MRKQGESPATKKVMIVLNAILSVAIITLALLQLFDISNTLDIFFPLFGVKTLLQSLQEWRKSRGSAIINLCVAIFILIASVIVLFAL